MAKYDELEAKLATDVGRNIGDLAFSVRGQFGRTLDTLASCKNVRITSGFFIPKAGVAETDGPPGAAILGAALRVTSKLRKVEFVTDRRCYATMVEAVKVCGFTEKDVLRLDDRDQVQALIPKWQSEKVDGLIAIERPAPSYDGIMRTMNAEPLQMYALDLAPLFKCVSWMSFGVGDGGNEIGMGKIPKLVIEKSIKNGAKIASEVRTDHLVVAGVSNWGAAGLAAALMAPKRRSIGRLAEVHSEAVRAMVRAGACDGKTLRKEDTVDGLSLGQHATILDEIQEIADGV
jgi:hypothetical protein